MSAASFLPLAVAVVLLIAAYLVWWLDRFRWEPLARFLVTALLAAVVSLGVVTAAASQLGSEPGGMPTAHMRSGAADVTSGAEVQWDWVRVAVILARDAGVMLVLLLLSRRGTLEGPLDGAVYGLAAASGVAGEAGVRLLLFPDPAGPWRGVFAALLGASALVALGAFLGRGVLAVRAVPLLGWSALGLVVSVALEAVGDLAWRAAGLGRSPWRWIELTGPLAALVELGGALLVVLWVERRVLARQLAEEVAFGVMPAWAADTISSYQRRVQGDWWTRGDERRALVRLVVSLAHKKEQLGFLPKNVRSLYGIEVGRLRQRARVLLADGSSDTSDGAS
jgi:hypothetical protein